VCHWTMNYKLGNEGGETWNSKESGVHRRQLHIKRRGWRENVRRIARGDGPEENARGQGLGGGGFEGNIFGGSARRRGDLLASDHWGENLKSGSKSLGQRGAKTGKCKGGS